MISLVLAFAVQSMTVPFHIVDRGTQSGVEESRQIVVRTADEWAALWRVHGMARERPKIDFTREMVVGVFIGSRPTAGFGVDIVGVAEESGGSPSDPRFVVRYREKTPGPDAITAQVLTSPYVLVSVPTMAGEVKFERVR